METTFIFLFHSFRAKIQNFLTIPSWFGWKQYDLLFFSFYHFFTLWPTSFKFDRISLLCLQQQIPVTLFRCKCAGVCLKFKTFQTIFFVCFLGHLRLFHTSVLFVIILIEMKLLKILKKSIVVPRNIDISDVNKRKNWWEIDVKFRNGVSH